MIKYYIWLGGWDIDGKIPLLKETKQFSTATEADQYAKKQYGVYAWAEVTLEKHPERYKEQGYL